MVDVSAPRIPSIVGPDGRIDPNGVRLLERFLHDLWLRTGGSDDNIKEIMVGEVYETGITDSKLIHAISAIEALQEQVEYQASVITLCDQLNKRLEDTIIDFEMKSNSKIHDLEKRIEDLISEVEMFHGA